jgi:hypothetical protein
MRLLYQGRYKQRFNQITPLLKGENIVELCFGDIYIAEYCRQHQKNWLGLDINEAFVDYAIRKGFKARHANLKTIESLPTCDHCVIIGSLYHFYDVLEDTLAKMIKSASQVIISEPVINLTNRQDWIGRIAAKSARITESDETFRFTEKSLLEALQTVGRKLHFNVTIINRYGKDLIVVLSKQIKQNL